MRFRKTESFMLQCTRTENMQSGFKLGFCNDENACGDIAIAAILF